MRALLRLYTFATDYLLRGGDIFAPREMLWHTTLEIVNHYLHFNSYQTATQHHNNYSLMDRLQDEGKEAKSLKQLTSINR